MDNDVTLFSRPSQTGAGPVRLRRATKRGIGCEHQMILKFPNLDTLRLALTTGTIPLSVSRAAAVAGFDEEEQCWVETEASLPRATQNELKRLGVLMVKTSGAALNLDVCCWAELLPLQADPRSLDRLEQTPVLFDLAGGEQLARLVTEILRLGNDRQSFRWLESDDTNVAARALLRVIGPPYYSLLRALDHNGKADSPRAFIERAPRVWVEVGQTHPFVEQIRPPEGKILLLQPPRSWTLLDDGSFRDIYEVLEFPLADAPVRWHDGQLRQKMKVTPTLKPGGSPDGAELWVLRDDPIEELNRFVQNADDQMLHRLAFAVGEKDGQKTIVLRVRPSKLPPPVVVLKAIGYRPYLKLPNLFLPVGTRLHPPLRRDVVRRLLAEDTSQITWLTPGANGSFTPESLPEDAFRPLWDWIEYVLDHDRENLQAWVQATQFDFEPFVCEEGTPKPKKPPEKPDKPPREKPSARRGRSTPETRTPGNTDKANEATPGTIEAVGEALPAAEPNVLLTQLRALEEQFVSLEGGLDTQERQALWPKMAELHARLGNAEEAGLCWAQALWWHDSVPAPAAWSWFRAEAMQVPGDTGLKRVGSWVTKATTAGVKDRAVAAADLDRLLAQAEPTAADVRALAAYLVWAARQAPPAALVERLNPVQRFLEAHENLLPVRSIWLAWYHLVQLSHGDVLALARARDRLLERLYQNGLRPEQDLPGFLRFAGQSASVRFRVLRQWLMNLCDQAQLWVLELKEKNRGVDTSAELTCGYIDLIFAFGFARLGEHDACRHLLQRAKTALDGQGEVASILLQAYNYRIEQALAGKPHAGPLPAELLEYLEALSAKENNRLGENEGRIERYAVDRLREHSRILEPHQEVNPYRHWHARTNDLDRELLALTDLTDKQQISDRIHKLWRDPPKGARGNEARARILREALNQAPRVSEPFAREQLDRVIATYDALPQAEDEEGIVQRAGFLEKALVVAAHFDRVEHIPHLLSRFQQLLEAQKGPPVLRALDEIAGKYFRGLRKLGLREEIDQLLKLMTSVILGGKDLQSLDFHKGGTGVAALRALLHVAAGWYFFGRDAQAEPVVQTARALLYKTELEHREQTALACAYAATLGQAPVELAQQGLEELFQRLKGVRDNWTTNRYYSLSQLKVVEAVVLAIVSDDFTLGADARRWLDEEEFLVRRRIHKDLRTMLGD